MAPPKSAFLTFLAIILCAAPAYARFFSHHSYSSSLNRLQASPPNNASTTSACKQTYGFLPCTTTALGNVFLILVYGYLMFQAATYLSSGSELLLQILGPGIVGGLFLPVLGAVPDAMLILVSGMSGSKATAQSQVSVGMGLLAGSTVMLLTVIWGSCIIVGKCDLENSIALDSKDTKPFSLSGSGISTDIWTSYASMIMAISVLPFIIVQIPQILHSKSGRHLAVLLALIVAVLLLSSYCVYQVLQPWIQRRRIAYAKHKQVISGILKHFKARALGKFYTEDGELNCQVMVRLFETIDENQDGYLSHAELKALIVGIMFSETNLNEIDDDGVVGKVMKDFDTSRDSQVDTNEFIKGIRKWLDEARGVGGGSNRDDDDSFKYIDEFHEQTRREHALLGDQTDGNNESVENPRWNTFKAVLFLLLGSAIAAAFADPLVDVVENFSAATRIPSFFISFVVLPLATNSSEAVSAIIFASRKKIRSASLTFSELYGAVTMNNVLCLSVFLALVYFRGLVWDFSAEVLVIVIVCIAMGIFGSIRTSFPLWTSIPAFSLYPFSLALVYVLDYILGWS